MSQRYATLGTEPGGPAVTLVAQADYHLRELDRVSASLRDLGMSSRIVIPDIDWKPLHRYRPTVRRLRQLLDVSGRTLEPSVSIGRLLERSLAVLVMNDWGVPRRLVEAAQIENVPSFALVEGVQDFFDVDTGMARHAYRRVDHVFTLGRAGAEVLGRERCTPVGSTRVSELWSTPALPAGDRTVINSNFTYGVLTSARRSWVDGVVSATEAAGRPWVLSRHVAERGRSGHPASRLPVGDLLKDCGHLVSRFSTVALDALALGIDLVYHNPHGEREPTFQGGSDGFAVTRTPAELQHVMARGPRDRSEVRAAVQPFLEHQVLLGAETDPADAVAVAMRGSV